MVKIYFTKEGLDKFMARIQEAEEVLKGMYGRLAHLADVGGDQYHDNFSYEQQMRDIDMRGQQLSSWKSLLSGACVVEPLTHKATTVCIGAKVVIARNGKEEEWEIVGYDESDHEHNRLAYNTPLAQSIMGKRVGESAVFRGCSIAIKSIN